MQSLPPGHSVVGARVPTLGGFVQRARRDSDGQEVLVRSAGDGYPAHAAVRHLDAELAAVGLDLEQTLLRPMARVDGHRQAWLLYEATMGAPLDTSTACGLEDFWKIAPAITTALAEGHRCGRVHGRLDGNCIWWDPVSGQARLLGMLPKGEANLANQLPPTSDTAPELLVSDRAPVLPSADVYSLGAVFYRLLSGRAPISSNGNLAFDVAANPPPRLDPTLTPRPLADLVTRMLSKSPVLRPPDADAVLEELRNIRAGSAPRYQAPNLMPGVIVGREAELRALLAHARSSDDGRSVVVRVAGPPGIGKSHLLAEFMRRLASDPRLVGAGKFEQFNPGRPYSALLKACSNALSHALASDVEVFTDVKQSLREANATLLAVLAADIPEIEHLCGNLPEVGETGPAETQNRFKRAFSELLSRLCATETPLVLVIDDLQWADRATADLLVQLYEVGLPERLMLILCYRDAAAARNPDLEKLFCVYSDTPQVAVGPLERAGTELLCRTLVPNCEGFATLADVVHQRSQGNALHCVELLKQFLANGALTAVDRHWRYVERGGTVGDLSETVAELVRDRLLRERPEVRRLLAAAASVGHQFEADTLSAALGLENASTHATLLDAAHRGFVIALPRGAGFVFCHDRIQQVALELSTVEERREVNLFLGRYYKERLEQDRTQLFRCLDHLNAVHQSLGEDERHELSLLNLEGARRARSAIAYRRAIPLLRFHLLGPRLSQEERFEATLLLAQCLFLSAADRTGDRVTAERAFEDCAAMGVTQTQKLRLLYGQLTSYVHDYNYAGAVDVGLRALEMLGHPLPRRPGPFRAVASAVRLTARMVREDPDALAQRPDGARADEVEVFRFLVGMWGPSFWVHPMLNVLLSVRLMEMTLRCGNGPHASMAYACYASICHVQQRYVTAIRYGRLANSLTVEQSPYTRAAVRFLTLTFFGVFEHPLDEVVRRYDHAVKEGVAHGEIVAAPLIDGAVTTISLFGPDLPNVLEALRRYEHEARAMGARTSLEIISLVRCWARRLARSEHPDAAQRDEDLLGSPVEHEAFAAGRDILRMQVEYLAGRDEEVLNLAPAVRRDTLMKGNPIFKASYALFVVLATTRLKGKFDRSAREALKFLERLDGVSIPEEPSPAAFRPSLRLAQGLRAALAGESTAPDLIADAARLARDKGQGLVAAICLERLAMVHGARGEYSLCVDRIRDAAIAFRRFGAVSRAEAIVREFPGVDWGHLEPRTATGVAIQVEGIMRAATAIVEATSTDELGPTLLRVIATVAGAMRAFLFAYSEGALLLVAGCERDEANLRLTPTPVNQVDTKRMALKPVHRVERTLSHVELPRDREKFLDDPYLAASPVPPALLCVPLLYRGELVAILYLEGSSSSDAFTQEQVRIIKVLGKQAAIAMTNADHHRLEVEALQAKVNPHFLYNALTVIAELIGRDPESAEDAVYRLTRLFRYVVSSSAQLRVPLERELALVRDYLELERARFGDRLTVDWDIADAATSMEVPALLIQPLAENAVNHGVRRNLKGGTVRVAAGIEHDMLRLTVSDDGPGWHDGEGGTRFGLKSIRRRLYLVYGDRARIDIVDANGVTVHLRIPV